MFGANADVLNIGPSTGVLTVASGANLDYEKFQTVVVDVRAQDSVDPPGTMSSATTITIHVMDTNDNAPVFKKTSYAEIVEENQPIGTTIVSAYDIVADDEDTGLGGTVSYSIVSANPSTHLDHFGINSTTGEIVLLLELDREDTQEIELTVRATDGGPSSFMIADVLLTITVTDVNDNKPVFNESFYSASVSEDIGSNAYVITVSATDEDDNLNGNVKYSLLNLGDVFNIVQSTGEISTSTNLDHEQQSQYSIVVEACDSGIPNKLCSNITVSVQVIDVNDLAPVYDYDIYYTSVCDDVSPVTDVLRVIAIDGDSGDFGKVTYSLGSGSDLGTQFTLDNDGQIKLVDEIPQSYIGTTLSVTIVASDGGTPAMTAETEVQISFCDRDTVDVYFNQSLYYGAVTENEIPPIHVTTVTAVSSYLPITYSILPPKSDSFFNITEDGMINTTMKLDREERETYSLIVEAVDSAPTPNTAYTTITVTILDVNDNPPLFLLTPYVFSLTEELANVTVVNKVAATDPDQPLNPFGIVYSIDAASNPDGVFSIDQNGTIYANDPVDRETTPQYKLTIKATDSDSTDPRITLATATITILDINDNRPVFDPPSYKAMISENHPPNFLVTKVSATDLDSDLNKEITYSIESGGDDKFFIDSTTGVINTLTQLNYEETPMYNITVKAQDKGSVPQSSFTSVIVTVEDYNDGYPMFTKSSYVASLPEDYGLTQSPILDIDVTDDDSGINQEVSFSIVAGNAEGKFKLNSTSGQLSLKNTLDFEQTTSYIIQIRATDGGTPSLSNLTQVYISVLDVNDNDPVFTDDHYDLSIPEDRNVGFEILVVSATDEDASEDNSNLIYSFLSGNVNGDFIIDQDTGSIKVDKELDREITPSYSLVIGVQDTGVPPRSANATVSITITDVNDNAPVISNLPPDSSINVLENATTQEVLFTVQASDNDADENSDLDFTLLNYENIFSIHPRTGEIKLQTALDYDDSDTEYQLSIEVTDLALDDTARLTDQATLNVLVQDINDNDPMFVEDEYEASRPEEEDPETVFVTVEATDDDGTTENNEITYVITNCTPSCLNSFSVDKSSGAVFNTQKLDREVQGAFVLTIMAINLGAYPERNDTTTVTITITDINDHAPEFTQDAYSTTISEGVAPNTLLFDVTAEDHDQPNTVNTELSYKIVSVIPNNPFLLNEDSGQLEVTGSIDREEKAFYNFTIRVEDNGETKLYHDVQVMITISDENDQPPVFVNDAQRVRVSEGLTDASLPYSLWIPSYTDNDGTLENTQSEYHLLNVVNGSNSLGSGSPLISINGTTGELFLLQPLDFETTKNLTVLISVNNTKDGTGDICDGDDTCSLSDTATLTIEVSDFNDNVPTFDSTIYTGQISTSAAPGTQVRQVVAVDKDTQNNFGNVRYRLLPDSSSKFSVESETGWVVSRGRFENDDGTSFNIKIEAYDNLGESPSRASTVEMTILALSDFKRVLILFNRTVTAFTEEKEKIIVDTLHNLTGYTIVVEEIREHVNDNGDIDTTKTDFIFHAINTNGEIIDFDGLVEILDVTAFFSAVQDCRPLSISPLQSEEDYPKVETLMIYLIALCGIILIGAIIVLVFACQQRYIALNSMWKSQMRDAFYGTNDPSLVEGVPRDFSGETFEMKRSTKSPLYVEPYTNFGGIESSAMGSSIGDVDSIQQGNPLYEERELRMDMFELSDDETDGDGLDDDNLLAQALKDDDSDSGSVTAI